MVYVDDMRMLATVGRWNCYWSHLTADTENELHEFAEKLKLKRSWFQEGKLFPYNEYNRERNRVGKCMSKFHYDVTDGKRIKAINLGAKELIYGSGEWMKIFFPDTWQEYSEQIKIRDAKMG